MNDDPSSGSDPQLESPRHARETEQDQRTATDAGSSERAHSPGRASQLPLHTPSSLRLLASTAEDIDDGIHFEEYMDQSEALLELLVNRTRALEVNNSQDASNTEEGNNESDAATGSVTQHLLDPRIQAGLRSVREAMRTADITRATMPPPPARTPLDPDESHATTLPPNTHMAPRHDHSQDYTARYIQVRAAREAARSSNTGIQNDDIPPGSDPNSVTERSASARRDLERALRDYRIARRALRNHHTNEPNPPRDQHYSNQEGLLAQTTELQTTSQNRMRPRGTSRASTLQRTDAIVDRIATATGFGNDAWRSDDDGDTVTGPENNSTNNDLTQQDRNASTQITRGPRSALPPGVSATSGIYVDAEVGRPSSGMRDFYRRLEDRERNPRPVFIPPDMRRPTANVSSEVAMGAGIGGRRRPEAELERPWSSLAFGSGVRRRTEADQEQTRGVSHAQPNEQLISFHDQIRSLQARTGKPTYSVSKTKAKRMVKYLSELKQIGNDTEKGLVLARDLDVGIFAETLLEEVEVDLPLRIDELPQPQYSSWLESGMIWEGVQKGGVGQSESEFNSLMRGVASGSLVESTRTIEDRMLVLRAYRHRERLRAERLAPSPGIQSNSTEPGDHLAGLLRGANNTAETLADMERHLSDLLEENERRLARDGDENWVAINTNFQPRPSVTTGSGTEVRRVENHWPVKVTIHEANWDTMTLTGTMIASQIPDRSASLNNNNDRSADHQSDMETFFDGEIVDFHTHELETLMDKPGYTAGGSVTDLKYWSRIGPFKELIEKKLRAASQKKAVDIYEKLGITGTPEEKLAEYRSMIKDEQRNAGDMNKDEVSHVVYDTMTDCLSSRKWINEAVNDWVLMRWKERCFITPPTTYPSSTSSRTPAIIEPDRAQSHQPAVFQRPTTGRQLHTVYTTSYSDDAHPSRTSWGLTIQGFYYVALHRMSGRIEALYYDAGSHPYQELGLKPASFRTPDEATKEGEDANKDEEDQKLDIEIGSRSDFGSWAFR